MTTTHHHLQIKTADIMIQDVITVDAEWTITQVIQTLLTNRISNAPVVHAKLGADKLIGFISEKDCINALGNPDFYQDDSKSVYQITRIHPICVKPETDIVTLSSIFLQHGFRHLPVVDRDYLLLGTVSRHDVLKHLFGYFTNEMNVAESERTVPNYENTLNSRFIVG